MAREMPSDADRVQHGWESGSEQPSFADLVQNVINDVQGLIRSEIRLARTELKEDVTATGRASAMLVGGAALAFYALGFLLLTVVYALATAMPNWLAALIVGVVVALVAGILAMVGIQRMKQLNLKPEQTVDTVKEDVEWVKQRAR